MRKFFTVAVVLGTSSLCCFAADKWEPEKEVKALYRTCNDSLHDHLLTANDEEVERFRHGWGGWRIEGIACYVYENPPSGAKSMSFQTAVSEGRFSEAFGMVGDTEHGVLAKRFVLAESKKRLKQLAGESVFQANPDKLAEASTIAVAFPAEPRAELNLFIAAEEAAARTTLAGLTPDAAARTAALRSVADRLFG